MLRLAIAIVVLAVSAYAAVGLTSAAGTDQQGADATEDSRKATGPASSEIWTQPAARAQVVVTPAAPAPAPERAQSANPLWAIPLSALSGTRDRPIFSASRRPPPAAVAPAAPPKLIAAPRPREPDRPQLSLVGTVASDEAQFGIFLDQSTKAGLRLKVGENHQGWKLRSVQGREVILEKDQEGVVLALPQSGTGQLAGAGQVASEVRSSTGNPGRLLSATSRSDRPERR
jgi:hypothetical protein